MSDLRKLTHSAYVNAAGISRCYFERTNAPHPGVIVISSHSRSCCWTLRAVPLLIPYSSASFAIEGI